MSAYKSIDEALIQLLKNVSDGKTFKEVMQELGDDNFDKAVEQARSYDYLSGIYPQRVASGRLTVDGSHKFGITNAGLDYLTGKSL